MTISSWLNFGRPVLPGRGSAAGRKFLAPPYYSQRAVFASLWALFHLVLYSLCYIRGITLNEWMNEWTYTSLPLPKLSCRHCRRRGVDADDRSQTRMRPREGRRFPVGMSRRGHVMSSGAKRGVSHGRRLMDAPRPAHSLRMPRRVTWPRRRQSSRVLPCVQEFQTV